MPRKKAAPTKETKVLKSKTKDVSIEELHPYDGFPYRLEYKDGNENRICHFETEGHRTKHITRYKLKTKEIKLSNKYDF